MKFCKFFKRTLINEETKDNSISAVDNRNSILKEYIQELISAIKVDTGDSHLDNWNIARIQAYNKLNELLDSKPPEYTIYFALERANSIRQEEYSVVNSGMYEVYRTWATIDIKSIVSKYKMLNKKH